MGLSGAASDLAGMTELVDSARLVVVQLGAGSGTIRNQSGGAGTKE